MMSYMQGPCIYRDVCWCSLLCIWINLTNWVHCYVISNVTLMHQNDCCQKFRLYTIRFTQTRVIETKKCSFFFNNTPFCFRQPLENWFISTGEQYFFLNQIISPKWSVIIPFFYESPKGLRPPSRTYTTPFILHWYNTFVLICTFVHTTNIRFFDVSLLKLCWFHVAVTSDVGLPQTKFKSFKINPWRK